MEVQWDEEEFHYRCRFRLPSHHRHRYFATETDSLQAAVAAATGITSGSPQVAARKTWYSPQAATEITMCAPWAAGMTLYISRAAEKEAAAAGKK